MCQGGAVLVGEGLRVPSALEVKRGFGVGFQGVRKCFHAAVEVGVGQPGTSMPQPSHGLPANTRSPLVQGGVLEGRLKKAFPPFGQDEAYYPLFCVPTL